MDFTEAFSQFVNEAASSGAASAVLRPVKGNCVVIPVVVTGKQDAPIILRDTYWNNKKAGRKGLMFGIGVSADDVSKWPEGYNARILPLDLPITVAQNVASILSDRDVSAGVSEIDENGVLTLNTVFKINRTGTGKETKYTVMPLAKLPNAQQKALPESFDLPETTLEALAEALTQREQNYTPETEDDDNGANGANAGVFS